MTHGPQTPVVSTHVLPSLQALPSVPACPQSKHTGLSPG